MGSKRSRRPKSKPGPNSGPHERRNETFKDRSVTSKARYQEINRLQNQLEKQHSEQYDCSPISVLPAELLLRVFALHRDAWLISDFAPPDAKWIGVSHVCRYWRSVALSSHSLWKHVPVNSRFPWLSEILKRSGGAPLSIRFSTSEMGSDFDKNIEPALKAADRLEELHVSASPLSLSMLFKDQKLPVLRSLFLRSSCDFETPIEIFAKDPPSLYSLRTEGLAFPTISPIYHNLVHLAITYQYPTSHVAIPEILDVLSHSPSLETLQLKNAFRSAPPYRSIRLPRLSRAEITGPNLAVSNLLDQIEFPSLQRLVVECIEAKTLELLSVFPAVARLCRQTGSRGNFLRTLNLRGEEIFDGYKISMQAWTTTFPTDKIPDVKTTLFDVLLCCKKEVSKPTATVVKELCRTIPVSNIESLSISRFFKADPGSIWTGAFGDFTRLRMLSINNMVEPAILKACCNKPKNKNKGTAKLLFPKLETLVISDAGKSFKSQLPSLEKFLKARKERGVTIKELRLRLPYAIQEGQQASLKKHVNTLECDNYGDFYDEGFSGGDYSDIFFESDFDYDEYIGEYTFGQTYDSDGFEFGGGGGYAYEGGGYGNTMGAYEYLYDDYD